MGQYILIDIPIDSVLKSDSISNAKICRNFCYNIINVNMFVTLLRLKQSIVHEFCRSIIRGKEKAGCYQEKQYKMTSMRVAVKNKF